MVTDLETRAVEALRRSDEATREQRAGRLLWLSRLPMPQAVAGRIELLRLIEDARACFICGHHVAVLMTATAAIDQTLSEALQNQGHKRPGSLEGAIESARSAGLFSEEQLDNTDVLRVIRNPFAHAKQDGHQHTLTERFRRQGRHPRSVQVDDSMLALQTMHAIFLQGLQSIA
jgi:hypothetical protein